ncbi:MAG TPA: diaminopimelate epimerase, partial [bacterium]|nr:diaminopimelate epimerase [bacterium]HPR87609.1 diaminopimelate epimerase [bacterium]
MRLHFIKISATGNDFILIDNRAGRWAADRDALFFSRICRHHLSIGADGVILLEPSERADFRYVHINADGGIAGMCGNGSRAIAWFARHLGIGGAELSMEINGRLYYAKPEGLEVTTRMVPPSGIDLELDAATGEGFVSGGFIDTGVPHYVLFVPEAAAVDMARYGPLFRHHPLFPEGTNVDFVECVDPHHLRARTWERGVEGETLACGTGAMAAAIIARLRDRVAAPVSLDFPGGRLTVDFSQDFSRVTLAGRVDPVYEGDLFPEHG